MNTWFSVHDDVRWFFLRESVYVFSFCLHQSVYVSSILLELKQPWLIFHSPILNTYTSSNPHTPANCLSILERLNTFPTEQAELNTWWVAELEAKPKAPSKKSKPNGKSDLDDDESDEDIEMKAGEDEEDDWRKFFDEPAPSTSTTGPHKRLHKLTVHQSLHSLPSHRAVFTRAWLTLLPALTFVGSSSGVSSEQPDKGNKAMEGEGRDKARKLTIRALNVMHRGVMPHLTRTVLVMDWVAGCVDLGQFRLSITQIKTVTYYP